MEIQNQEKIKLTAEDQAIIEKYKSRILESIEKSHQNNQTNQNYKKPLELIDSKDFAPSIPQTAKSPVNRLNAVIFNTTDRINLPVDPIPPDAQKINTLNVEEFQMFPEKPKNKAPSRIMVPTFEELEAKTKISSNLSTKNKLQPVVMTISGITPQARNARILNESTKIQINESQIKRESPMKQLMPKVMGGESTKRDQENLTENYYQNPIKTGSLADSLESDDLLNRRRQSAGVENEKINDTYLDPRNITEVREIKVTAEKKPKKATQTKLSKPHKITTLLQNKQKVSFTKNTSKSAKKIKPNHQKSIKRPGTSMQKRGTGGDAVTANKKMNEKLWEIVKKHARKCPAFEMELQKEGLL